MTEAAVISVPTNLLEAVAKWAGTDETRPHLHQVLFTQGTMVAVDGHRLIVAPCETFGMTVGVDRSYLLAAVAAQRAMKVDPPHVITIEPALDGTYPRYVRLGFMPNSFKIGMIVMAADDSSCPPYKQVMRDSAVRPAGGPDGYGFDPRYLAAIAEVDAATTAAGLGRNGVEVVSWSEDRLGAMTFRSQAGVTFLVMPMRP
jgi:hypothetical protein